MHFRVAHPVGALLRLVVVTGLGVDAYVHLHLAAGYQLAAPGGVGGGTLFRLEATAALLAGLWVLFRGTKRAFLSAATVATLGVVAVVLYRYADLPGVGPLPSMYEPVWYPEKTLSAVAEGIAAVAAVLGRRRAGCRQPVREELHDRP